MTVPYYRNSNIIYGGVVISELTRAGIDSVAFFDGPAADSSKQQMLEKLVTAAKYTVVPVRAAGFIVDIGRSYSEGAANHSTGYALDLVPHSKLYDDCLSIANYLSTLNTCDQVWIEASDDVGSFHVHAKANPNGFNENPSLKTITTRDGSNTYDGLLSASTTVKNSAKV